MKNKVSIFFHFWMWCAWIATTHASTSITSVAEFLDTQHTAHYKSSLKSISREEQLECFWQYQQRVEDAHVKNNTNAIEQIYKAYLPAIMSEQSWQWLSEDILSSASPASPYWQNWYSRWQKWEAQSSWSEAVLSALFYPYSYFLESGVYGVLDNYDLAVMYSLKISASYHNSEARLYYVNHVISEPENETPEITEIRRSILDTEVASSSTDVGQELWASYKSGGQRERALGIYDRLAPYSVTAFYFKVLKNDDTNKRDLFLEVGKRGYWEGNITALRYEKDKDKKIEILANLDKRGYVMRYQLTGDRRDLDEALDYLIRRGDQGIRKCYLDAASLLLNAPSSQLMKSDYHQMANLFVKALSDGFLWARSELNYFVTGNLKIHFDKEEHLELKQKVDESYAAGLAKYNWTQEELEKLSIY